jgi:solute carrier family 13 (sodium-dependent dicarboxylate transporter), member 2/3/5
MTDASLAASQPRPEMDDEVGGQGVLGRVGLVLGPGVALGLYFGLGAPEGLSAPAWASVCLLALIVIWWVTEAIPVAATALVPLLALPLVAGVKPAAAAAPYADPIIYLFVGGFILAAAVERWGLHRRFAFLLMARIGVSPGALVAGCLASAGLLSMWISNTATALMLTPIALGVAGALKGEGQDARRLGGALVVSVAYAASIGGVATPVGSPTNLVAMGWLERNGLELSFVDWMLLATPLAGLMLVIAWVIIRLDLVGAARNGDAASARQAVARLQAELGPMRAPERRVLIVFGLVACGWIFREQLIKAPGLSGLSDMQIAIAGALSLFLIPSGETKGERLLDWQRAERIPWGIALLFGAGLSMAAAMDTLGVTKWLAGELSFLGAWTPLAILAAIVALTVFLSEFASNTATLTAFLPVVGAVAAATGMAPLYLVFGACMGASLAFMMPVGTPPNAIAYATGLIDMKRMLRLGLVLNLAGIALTVAVLEWLGPMVLASTP